MKPLHLDTRHLMKLRYMLKSLTDYHGVGYATQDACHGMLDIQRNGDEHSTRIHWFELAMMHLIPYIAQHYAAKYPQSMTISWAKNIIKQRILNEYLTDHPIDFLFDIWRNPSKYVETL